MNRKFVLLVALFVAFSNVFCATLAGTPQEQPPTATMVPPSPSAAPESQAEPEGEPISGADFAYTIAYPEAWDYYQRGKADPATKKTIESASFTDKTIEEIHEALETKKIVILNGEFTGETGSPESFSGVLTALNLAADPDGYYYICIVDIVSGQELSGKFHLRNDVEWIIFDSAPTIQGEWVHEEILILMVEIFDRPSDVKFCYPYVTMIAFNITRAPFDDAEARKAFAHAFDKERYLRESFGNTEGMATGFIPTSLIQGITPHEDALRDKLPPLGPGPFKLGEWEYRMAHCNECEGSDWMSRNIIAQWKEALEIEIKQVPLTYEQYQRSVREQEAGMVFLAKGGYSWYTFLYYAMSDLIGDIPSSTTTIDDGTLEELNIKWGLKLASAALETDPEKRKEIILEIDRWLVQEHYLVIPIKYTEQCE